MDAQAGMARVAHVPSTVTSGKRSSHSMKPQRAAAEWWLRTAAGTAGLDGGEEAAFERELGVADRVDAAVDRVQAAVEHAV